MDAILIKFAGMLLTLAVIFGALTFAGCARRGEGDGFSNGGVERPPACVIRRERNTEIWGNC